MHKFVYDIDGWNNGCWEEDRSHDMIIYKASQNRSEMVQQDQDCSYSELRERDLSRQI